MLSLNLNEVEDLYGLGLKVYGRRDLGFGVGLE